MDLPKLFQRGASFKFAPSSARYHYYSNAHNNNAARSACKKKIWVTFILSLTLFSFLYFFLLRKGHHVLEYSQQQGEYGVVIDIGRLGARIHVLQFEGTETVAVRVLGRKHSLATVKVPILLGDFLEYAKGHVPASERAQTRVYVLGTGGLEWIPVQNRLDMLQECRKIIHESEFMFHDDWAMVLNGEFLTAWLR